MEESKMTEEAMREIQLPRSGRKPINASCDRYVCRDCRTKTGWPHKLGCELMSVTEPDCADCRYWSAKKRLCDHPVTRRERAEK